MMGDRPTYPTAPVGNTARRTDLERSEERAASPSSGNGAGLPSNRPLADKYLVTIKEFIERYGTDIEWIWEPITAPGLVTLLAAEPKVGKSTLLIHFLNAAMKEVVFLEGQTRRPTEIWIFSEEGLPLSKRIADSGLLETAREADCPVLVNDLSPTWKDLVRCLNEAPRRTLVILDTGARFWVCARQNDNWASYQGGEVSPGIGLGNQLNQSLL